MTDICKMPYVGVVIDSQGNISYCCMGSRSIYQICRLDEVNDLNDFFVNSQELNKVRSMFEEGEYKNITPCGECYKKEKSGIKTFKEIINNKYKQEVKATKIKFLEFTASNLCNAVCATCNSNFSSSWGKYESLFGRTPSPISRLSDESIKKIENILPELEHFMIKGGEPFADKNNFYLLDKLFDNNSNCKIVFVTNMSILQEYQLEILKKNPTSVEMYVSIDGIGKVYNWIRSTDFDIVVNNMKRLYEECGIEFNITTTISVYNIFNLNKILQYFQNIPFIKSIDFTNILHKPKQSSIKLLPKEILKTQMKKISLYPIVYDKLTPNSLEYLTKFYNSIEDNFEDLNSIFDYISLVNTIRGFDVCDHVPELQLLKLDTMS